MEYHLSKVVYDKTSEPVKLVFDFNDIRMHIVVKHFVWLTLSSELPLT